LSVADDHLRIYLELRRGFDGALAATFVTELQAVARPGSGGISIIGLPAEARPKGLEMHAPRSVADLAEADRLGLIEIYRSAVQPAQVDRDGALIHYHLMGMMADGILHLLVQLDPAGAQGPHAAGMGGATLESRLIYRRPAQTGDLVVIRSGVIAVADKVQTFGHWILDLVTGEAIATIEQVVVGFDMATRKVAAMSPDVRQRMTAAMVPGLSA
jgi:acyl-CoA thioester hydrolase